MTREEVAKLLPILQAFAEGRVIQYRENGVWKDITTEDGFFTENAFVNVNDYRIKPELTYRPFTNEDECWQEMLKHQPVGWVKSRCDKTLIQSILSISKEGITLVLDSDNFCVMFDTYTFADGSIFGVKEESEG